MESRTSKEELVGIPEFYKDKTIFVTGYTGFLGKIIVEKLLYSCPKIGKIYVLIRDKKGKGYLERASEVASSLAFSRLKKKYPTALETKVVPIKGDIIDEKLGLSDEDAELLEKEVNIIFYGAASVRFNDPLDQAVKLNTLGTKSIVDLALAMPNLLCLCYVSTAYTNCDQFHIKEAIHPPKADWRDSIRISQTIDPVTVQILCNKYIDQMPNTYAFTKSLAEQVINDHKDKIPSVILRPSIVLAADKEPMPGWVDTINGSVAFWIGGTCGIIKCYWVDVNATTNFVDSDAVVNSVIVSTWKTALTYKNKSAKIEDDVPVYNMCSNREQGVTNEEFNQLYQELVEEDEFKKHFINFYDCFVTKYEWWFSINALFRHVLPSLFVDLILVLLQIKPILLSIRRKVTISFKIFHHFTNNTFYFDTEKCTSLLEDLNAKDREDFGWCLDDLKVRVKKKCYKANHIASKTFLKPLYDEFETNKKRLRWLYYVDKGAVYLTYATIGWLIYSLNIPQGLYNSIIGLVYF